jgi:hypothetical protein
MAPRAAKTVVTMADLAKLYSVGRWKRDTAFIFLYSRTGALAGLAVDVLTIRPRLLAPNIVARNEKPPSDIIAPVSGT